MGKSILYSGKCGNYSNIFNDNYYHNFYTCSIHDEIIKENVISQTAIENELNDMSIDRKNEFEKIAEGFLKERCIFSHDYEVRVDNSSIKKSEPEKSIRIMRAIMEAID